MASELLPRNKTEFEVAFSDAVDRWDELDPAILAMRQMDFETPPTDWLPFMIWEFGLGPLTPYVPDLYQLIDEGVDWQRVRGTDDAISRGFSWLGYTHTLEEFPVRRRRWNRFMVELDRIRDNEEPDLERIDALANLSTCLRSIFWRGFYYYDVRALDFGYTAWGDNLYSAFSGARIPTNDASWSFGRVYEDVHKFNQAELTALGIWIAPTGGSPSTWGAFTWNASGISWNEGADLQRLRLMATSLAGYTYWIEFLDSSDQTIGYRRQRICHQVAENVNGIYDCRGKKWAITTDGESVFVEFLTDFGDGYGKTAAKARLHLEATPTDPAKPGLLWAEPGELSNVGTPYAEFPVSIEFGRTVRERVCLILGTFSEFTTSATLSASGGCTLTARPDPNRTDGTLFGTGDILAQWTMDYGRTAAISGAGGLTANAIKL